MSRIDLFRKDLKAKKAVKIISGIDNFDKDNVRNVVMAAEKAGASAVDICADEDIIRMVQEMSSIPVFVSSIEPQKLLMAKELGVDALEIGNFDALYRKGLRISAEEVYNLTSEVRTLVGDEIFLSVTIPGHIDVNEQIELARKLENLNVDLIQTEGASVANIDNNGARGLMEKVNVSVANTIEIINNCDIPVMTASGITTTTCTLPFAIGASAIGVGSCVNKLSTPIEMIAVIKTLMEKVGLKREAFELV